MRKQIPQSQYEFLGSILPLYALVFAPDPERKGTLQSVLPKSRNRSVTIYSTRLAAGQTIKWKLRELINNVGKNGQR